MKPSLRQRLRQGGWRWLWRAAWDRIAPQRPAFAGDVRRALAGRRGIEIGGPSRVFRARGALPVYPEIESLDNVNFAGRTAWESPLADGAPFHFQSGQPPGTQFLREATALQGIADARYDFVLSSHCLEHVANPLRALHEWRRVTRAGGHLVLVLPDPARSFDHRRPVTTLEHLRADLARDTGEDDGTHVAEVLALHDLARDPGAGTPAEFRARTLGNAEHRCVHHHVFDLELMAAALREAGWRVLALEAVRPVHQVAFARKEAP